ncbi:MAG: cytochrome c [Hyphomonadaceae bacterium]|nr:cytochrome c [Hyphomonadaceae bacterium]
MALGVGARIAVLGLAQAFIGVWVYLAAHGSADAARAPALDATARRGQAVWRENGCASCHALFGLGGHMGPDLTNVTRRRGPDYVAAALTHGLGRMPPRGLAPEDINAVNAYLAHIDSLATYPLPSLTQDSFGQFGAGQPPEPAAGPAAGPPSATAHP